MLFVRACGLLLIHLFVSCIVSCSTFKPTLVGGSPGYVVFNYGGRMGNRALSEAKAAKPVRTCALLKVQPYSLPGRGYYIASGGLLVRYVSFFSAVKLCCSESYCTQTTSWTSSCDSSPARPAYMNGTVTQIQYAKCEIRHLRGPGKWGVRLYRAKALRVVGGRIILVLHGEPTVDRT